MIITTKFDIGDSVFFLSSRHSKTNIKIYHAFVIRIKTEQHGNQDVCSEPIISYILKCEENREYDNTSMDEADLFINDQEIIQHLFKDRIPRIYLDELKRPNMESTKNDEDLPF